MVTNSRHFAIVGLMMAATACGGGGAPSGQVVATVDGQEITSNELAQELGGARGNTPQAQKALQQAALQTIIRRRVLAAAAREDGVEKLPAYAVQKQKAEDLAAIGLFEQKLVASVPAPSAEEVTRFVAEHPDSFAERKIYALDQLIVPQVSPQVAKQVAPLRSLAQVAELLDRSGVAYQRSGAVLDGAANDPDAVKRVASLPPGEVFIVPNGGGFVANTIRDMRVQPITGAKATELAQRLLKQKRTQEIVVRRMDEVVKKGVADVKYNAAFQPAPSGATPAKPTAG